MALRREARKAGFSVIKKTKRAPATSGPCVDYGEHLNIEGRKGDKWGYVGSLTSCKICEDTSRGPRLLRSVWRVHQDF